MPGAFSSIVERSDARRMFLYMLWPAGLALGVVAAWVGEPELVALDGVTGFALLGLGLIAWSRRPQSAAGPIMAAAGFAWFLGSLFGFGGLPPPGAARTPPALVSGQKDRADVVGRACCGRRRVRLRGHLSDRTQRLRDDRVRARPRRPHGAPVRLGRRPRAESAAVGAHPRRRRSRSLSSSAPRRGLPASKPTERCCGL